MKDLIINIVVFFLIVLIVVLTTLLILSELNEQVPEYEKSCTRVSIDSNYDNCMCPCDKPNWIEKKLNLRQLCDGWIVPKNQSCFSSIR
jgi:hypothetical protein